MGKIAAGALGLALALLGDASAATPPPASEACSNDTFSVDGSPLGVQVCAQATDAKGASVAKPAAVVQETFSYRGASFAHTLTVEFLAGAEISRTIDDVSLARLGIAKTLHLSIAYKPGSARLEHALLVPGAIALK
ncbi:MAG TPA: hypothetical protein VKG44_06445 [Candidatus Baltobacteraceae bacterium]|nr:hypothetical protein [Candidatus Baltobacteraceae bacterium]